MPNWIEGTLKLRGKRDNILKFFREGINVYSFDYKTDKYNVVDRAEWYKETVYSDDMEIDIQEEAHIDGTRRAFVKPTEVYVFGKDHVTVTMPFKQAWAFLTDQYYQIAKTYEIDIRGYGIEQGMEFCQEFEIIAYRENGIVKAKTTIDKEIKYKDWDWECPFPRMGG